MTDRFRHLLLHHDTGLAWRFLHNAGPNSGTVVFQVAPDIRRRHELGQEILSGFGKRSDVSGVGRHANIDWELLPAWFEAHRVKHLVALGTETLPRDLWPDLTGLTDTCNAALWAVAYQPAGEFYATTLERHPHIDTTLEELADVIAEPAEAPEVEPWFPTVPVDSFFTFLAACRDQLDPASFDAVKARYTSAATSMRTWLGTTAVIDEDAVVSKLRELMAPCVAYDEVFTVLRACQAAGHVAGWHVAIDPLRFCATAESSPAATIADPRTWQRLAAYRAPYRAATCALAAAGFALDEITALAVGDIDTDGTAASKADEGPTSLPDGSAVYLRAQVALRRQQGAADADPLFLETARTLADAVRAPASDLGINLMSGAFQRATFDDRSWTRRWGVSVQDIR